jgi:hypothetical protein
MPGQTSASLTRAAQQTPAARSGAGFILPFFLGVIDMLYRDLGVMHADMPAAGASSGAIAVA